ncbi:MAG: ribosome maturation factor RimM [Bacillota bacterium]
MSAGSPQDKLVDIGKVVAIHGLKGLIQVLPLTDFPDRFADRRHLYAERADGSRVPVKVTRVVPHKSHYLMALDGVNTRDEAETFAGAMLKVPEAEIPSLPEGTYYHFQLVGLKVTDEAGQELGRLREIVSGPANDIYVVDDGRRELLLPATKEVVRRVDLGAGVIVARPLEEWK